MYFAALMLLAAAVSGGTPQAPKTGEDVIRQMYQRYAGKWYSTLTFVQKTTQPNGTVETWYEAARFPGYLRIDIAPLDSGKAIIFRADSIYQLAGGKVTVARPFLHPLLILGFDVYAQPVERTIEQLRSMNFDLTKLASGTWQGKNVWIVGTADAADAKANQFWIEKENLLFARMLRTTPQGVTNDARFNKYFATGGGWVAPEVLFFSNGTPGTKEEYSDVKTGMTFAPDLFEPAKFAAPGWVK